MVEAGEKIAVHYTIRMARHASTDLENFRVGFIEPGWRNPMGYQNVSSRRTLLCEVSVSEPDSCVRLANNVAAGNSADAARSPTSPCYDQWSKPIRVTAETLSDPTTLPP